MTQIDTEKLARGWGLIAEGAMEISLAYSAIEQPAAGVAVPSVPPAPTDLPPFTDADFVTDDAPPMKPQVDAGLSKCPVHGVSWTVRAAGVSKTGKPYQAFWKCDEKTDGNFCSQKPQRIWSDTHPASAAA